jgi:hypothetical protein
VLCCCVIVCLLPSFLPRGYPSFSEEGRIVMGCGTGRQGSILVMNIGFPLRQLVKVLFFLFLLNTFHFMCFFSLSLFFQMYSASMLCWIRGSSLKGCRSFFRPSLTRRRQSTPSC